MWWRMLTKPEAKIFFSTPTTSKTRQEKKFAEMTNKKPEHLIAMDLQPFLAFLAPFSNTRILQPIAQTIQCGTKSLDGH